MTKAEIIEYLYENNVKGDITIEQMAEDLADRKTENSLEKPNNFGKDINVRSKDETQRGEPSNRIVEERATPIRDFMVNGKPKDEPQTETEIAKAIVHKMIDDAVIAEDAYPDLRQKMHDAVGEYEPQTDEPPMDEYYKDHDEFYDCARYVITNDEGERAYNCIGCQTDCPWK